MKRIKLIIFTLIFVISASLTLGGFVVAEPSFGVAEFDRTNRYVQDEIIIKLRGDTKPFRVVKIPKGRVLEEIERYRERADILYAEPNYIAQAFMVPNDPYYSYQWNLNNTVYGGINLEPAWDVSTGSGVIVAVIDTGVAYENYQENWTRRYYLAPDLSQTCFVNGYDFVNNDNHPNDDNSHGTHVAGTVAQSTNNGIGTAGVAFEACLMPIKVLDRNGSGTYSDVAEGIRFAADNGAKVINLSLGGPAPSSTLEEAVAYAYNKGVTIVAAAGNDNSSNLAYPAAYDNYVIAVGATQYDEALSSYSNYGSSLDLVAPGGNNNLDQNNDGYNDGILQNTFNPNTKNTRDFGYWFFQGTSMAAPHVSGVASLLLAKGKTATPNEVRTILEATAEDLGSPGRDNTFGWGLVDAFAALSWNSGCEPETEICDGIDNDCDGLIDEELGQTTCGIGACQMTVDNCLAGIPQVCTPATPSEEICDNIDNDCDGLIDEELDCMPQTEEFNFTGTVSKQEEARHIVNILFPGAKDMYVKLTWNSFDDLRLRLYNPSGDMVKEIDESSWRNRVEETIINNLETGDWQIGVFSESRRRSTSYSIEGVINY